MKYQTARSKAFRIIRAMFPNCPITHTKHRGVHDGIVHKFSTPLVQVSISKIGKNWDTCGVRMFR